MLVSNYKSVFFKCLWLRKFK